MTLGPFAFTSRRASQCSRRLYRSLVIFYDDFDRLSPLTNMAIAELAFGTRDVFLATDALIRISTFGRRVDKQYGALAQRSRHFGSLDGVVTTATPLEIGSLICFDLVWHSAAIKLLMEKNRCP
ncbi:BQ5605_C015g07835 [Microbotryum silenes-dioicae]|uniref:BQ5605_C015g07835 protein n=1 Tax=Microbotryum silenes-dioicae TaxID=796604 RepID=A0A2X0NW74_9BASI|nr:BQ5605_C015g07835 [Microbotryum silenes-dioicae]